MSLTFAVDTNNDLYIGSARPQNVLTQNDVIKTDYTDIRFAAAPLSGAVIDANGAQIGTGNGVLRDFSAPIRNPQIYKTDWQGRQLQYTTPRTNYCRYSENLTTVGGYWSTTLVTPTQDATTAPNGELTADLITETAASGVHSLSAGAASAIPAGIRPAAFCFVKPNGRSKCFLFVQSAGGIYDTYATFDLSAGVVISGANYQSAAIYSLPGGWWFIGLVAANVSQTTAANFRLYLTNDSGTLSYAGDGVSGMYVWGATLTENEITSYIPNPGTTAVTVTDYAITAAGGSVTPKPSAVYSIAGAEGSLALATGLDAVMQAAQQAAQTQLAEMMYAVDQGVPNFASVWNGAANVPQFEAYLRRTILAVNHVTGVRDLVTSVADNRLSYRAVIETEYGPGVLNG